MSADDRGLTDLERRALEIWREREMWFPARVRRDPDAIDRATGAWQACLLKAAAELTRPSIEGE